MSCRVGLAVKGDGTKLKPVIVFKGNGKSRKCKKNMQASVL